MDPCSQIKLYIQYIWQLFILIEYVYLFILERLIKIKDVRWHVIFFKSIYIHTQSQNTQFSLKNT